MLTSLHHVFIQTQTLKNLINTGSLHSKSTVFTLISYVLNKNRTSLNSIFPNLCQRWIESIIKMCSELAFARDYDCFQTEQF